MEIFNIRKKYVVENMNDFLSVFCFVFVVVSNRKIDWNLCILYVVTYMHSNITCLHTITQQTSRKKRQNFTHLVQISAASLATNAQHTHAHTRIHSKEMKKYISKYISQKKSAIFNIAFLFCFVSCCFLLLFFFFFL